MALAPRQTLIPAPYVALPSQEWDGNDGSWSTFAINVGSPGQDFRVLISTSGSAAFVPVPEGCSPTDPANCASLRGVQSLNGASSPGFQTNRSSTWTAIGLYSLDLEARLNYSGNGLYGYDRLGLGTAQGTKGPSLDRQVVAGIADKDYFMGILGLGVQPSSFSSASEPIPSFLRSLRDQSSIPSLSFGYTAGAPYRLKKVLGSLVLGGFEQSRLTPSNTTFSFSSDDSRTLTVGVQSIIGSSTLLGTASFTATSGGHLSLIDSTVPEIWLPRAVCDAFRDAFGLTYDPTTDLYIVNNTMHSRLKALNPTVTFRLGNTAYDNGNGTNIALPYAAFDLQASWPIYPNATNYFPIRRAANDSQYTLGRTFLQEAYLIVDYERRNFSVAQVLFGDPPPPQRIVTITSLNATGSSNDTRNESSPLSGGALAGIVVGAIAIVALLIAGGLLIRRRRRRQLAELADREVSPGSNEDGKHHSTASELGGTTLQELPSPPPQSAEKRFGQPDHKQAYTHELSHELPYAPLVHELPADHRRLSHEDGIHGLR